MIVRPTVRRRGRLLALAAAAALVVASCGGDDGGSSDSSPATDAPTTEPSEPTDTEPAEPTDTEPSEPTDTEAPAPSGWTVDSEDCPSEATEPIEGTLKIGLTLPLSESPAALAFSPVKDGAEAYIDYANDQGLLEGVELELLLGDDKYSEANTPGVVDGLLDDGVRVFAGTVGTPQNLAIRDTLNEECIPQILALTGSTDWAEIEDYPFTTGILVPYDIEVQIYATQIAEQFPDATVALYTVNNDFGQIYVDNFEEIAPDLGLEIVTEQTIEVTESGPPSAQVNAIASEAPDVIVAAPSGLQCATFLQELENAKAANSGWEPAAFLTNTCASALILGAAGAAADGIYTSNNLKDVTDPDVAGDEGVTAYLEVMEERGAGDLVTTASAGWNSIETAVAVLVQAAQSEAGLTQVSIIEAARNFEYTPSLAREGVVYRLAGEEDQITAESLQVLQFDFESQLFTEIGDLITEFESS